MASLLLPRFTNMRCFGYFNMDYIQTEMNPKRVYIHPIHKKLEHLVNGGSNSLPRGHLLSSINSLESIWHKTVIIPAIADECNFVS